MEQQACPAPFGEPRTEPPPNQTAPLCSEVSSRSGGQDCDESSPRAASSPPGPGRGCGQRPQPEELRHRFAPVLLAFFKKLLLQRGCSSLPCSKILSYQTLRPCPKGAALAPEPHCGCVWSGKQPRGLQPSCAVLLVCILLPRDELRQPGPPRRLPHTMHQLRPRWKAGGPSCRYCLSACGRGP